jgi:tetratricopeptide (TPR) repeat protein
MRRYLSIVLLLVACGPKTEGPGPKAGLPKVSGPVGPDAKQQAQTKFAKAMEIFHTPDKDGKIDVGQVRATLIAAVKDDGTLVEAWHNLGVLAEQENKQDDAIAAYSNALKANPKYAPSMENMAGVMVAQGKQDDAMKALEDYVKLEPGEPRPRVALATIYREKKRYDEALEQCRAALQREPKNLLAFETMAGTYAEQGNVPMSRLVGARGLKVDAKDAAIHHVFGRHLLNENKIPEAVLEFKQALDANPRYRPARIDIAEVALTYRDFGNAKVHYTELLAETPNDIAALLGLGIANKGLGMSDEAKLAYEKVLKLQPKNPAATLNLAILYHRTLNDFAGALKTYKAYQENPAQEGPKPDEIKANITELEATIDALRQAEEYEKQAREQAATMEAQQPQGEPAPASQPAPQ